MASDEQKQGFLTRLRAKVNKPGSWLSYDLANLFRGRKIDDAILEELEARLLAADVGVEATEALLEQLRRRVARNELGDVEALIGALRDAIAEMLAPCQQPLVIDPAHQPFVVLVVGVNGSGKTTSIGKLARRLAAEGRKVMLAAGDTFRAAAIEQLTVWAERSGADLVAQQSGADPASVAFDAMQAAKSRGCDVLLADTAGRLHSQSHLMDELRKVRRVIARVDASAPHEVLLVLDANQGQNALAQALQFHAAIGRHRARADEARRHRPRRHRAGDRDETALSIRFIGIGEGAEDFGEFDARAFAQALVEGAGSGDTARG
ncbi:MAG: signal recognition particle-docking protein FtsY [Steroidobacteraceae bacterium]